MNYSIVVQRLVRADLAVAYQYVARRAPHRSRTPATSDTNAVRVHNTSVEYSLLARWLSISDGRERNPAFGWLNYYIPWHA